MIRGLLNKIPMVEVSSSGGLWLPGNPGQVTIKLPSSSIYCGGIIFCAKVCKIGGENIVKICIVNLSVVGRMFLK